MPTTDVEVGGGYVERVAFVVTQEVVEDVGHFMALVVDDEWDVHDVALLISFLRLVRQKYGAYSAYFEW